MEVVVQRVPSFLLRLPAPPPVRRQRLLPEGIWSGEARSKVRVPAQRRRHAQVPVHPTVSHRPRDHGALSAHDKEESVPAFTSEWAAA